MSWWKIITASAFCLAAGQAFAQGATTEQSVEELEARVLQFDDFGWPPKARLGNDNPALRRYVAFNREQWERHRISWLVAPTLMYQHSTQDEPDNATANYQHNLLFVWRPVESARWGTGTFVFNYLEVFQLTDTTGANVTEALGLSYPISDSTTDSGSLKALYWQQDTPDGRHWGRAGHIELNDIVASCAYLCDDTQSFIAAPLSANVTSTLPGQGWGVIGSFGVGQTVALQFGVTDGNGDGNLNTDRAVQSDELAYAASVVIDDPFRSLGSGKLRLSYYRVDRTETFGAGSDSFAVNYDQDLGDLAIAARYAQTDGRLGTAKRTAALAGLWTRPFGHETDVWGLGFAFVDPSGADTDREYVAETYYRVQLTPLSQLTAGVMLVTRPNAPGDTSNEAVLNLRWRIAL